MKILQCGAVALLAGLAVATLAQPAHAQIAVGGCVVMAGNDRMVFNVTEQAENGNWHIVFVGTPNSGGQWERSGRLVAAPCPGPRTAVNGCFASSSERSAGDQQRQIVAHALIYTITQQAGAYDTVRVRNIQVGGLRQWTGHEYVDSGSDPDRTRPVFDAAAAWDACQDDGAFIHVAHFQARLLCFVSNITGGYNCGIADGQESHTTENLQKY